MKRIIPIVLLSVMLLTACGGGSEEEVSESPIPTAAASTTPRPTATPTPTPTPTPEPTPTPVPSDINPLTGLKLEEGQDAASRPAAFMINNIKQALPQYGTASADILYEVVAEGGITRLVAVMQDPSAAGIIGSIRSTRAYYLDIAGGHDAILFHAGGSDEAYSLIRSRSQSVVDNVRQGGNPGSTFYLDAARKRANGYEHSTMTTGENVASYLERTTYSTTHPEGYDLGLRFEEGYTPQGDDAAVATVKFSSYKKAKLTYDEDSGKYLVEQYGRAHVDEQTGEQLAFDNVLVLYTKITAIPGDKAGRMRVELTGSGEGTYICGGKSAPINWSKEDWDKPFVYTNASGENQTLRAGRTYVCIVESDERLTIGE